jgi:hypothetical protein
MRDLGEIRGHLVAGREIRTTKANYASTMRSLCVLSEDNDKTVASRANVEWHRLREVKAQATLTTHVDVEA